MDEADAADEVDEDVATKDVVEPVGGTGATLSPEPIVVDASAEGGVAGAEPLDAEVVGDGVLLDDDRDCGEVEGGEVDSGEVDGVDVDSGTVGGADVDGSSVSDTAGPVDAIPVFTASRPA